MKWQCVVCTTTTDLVARKTISESLEVSLLQSSFQGFSSFAISAIEDMPDIDTPEAVSDAMSDLASSIPALGSIDPAVALPVVGVIVVAALAAIASGSSSSTSSDDDASGRSATASPAKKSRGGGAAASKPKVDVSIPYNAAARLAYDNWCQANEETYKEEAFAAFESLYVQKSVADATAKKLERDLASFVNEAPKTPPPRKITPRKAKTATETEKVPEMFFAN